MKSAITILLFVFLAHSAMIASGGNVPYRYIVFQPDNRTTTLEPDDVNAIWRKIEGIAQAAGGVMGRDDFHEMQSKVGLEPTGSNLRREASLKKRLAAEVCDANLIFTRITNWGNHFNVAIENVSVGNATTPNFNIKRAALPLSAKIYSLEQILEHIPSLMEQLGVFKAASSAMPSQLSLIRPEKPTPQLNAFYDSLQKYLAEAGIETTADTADGIRISAVFDTFDCSSQTLDLPMQNRKIVKRNINVVMQLFLKDKIFKIQKSTERTFKPNADQLDIDSFINSFIDTIAHDSVGSIMQELKAK